MAGDPLRDAFRAELEAVRVATSIPWLVKDTLNTNVNPDAGAGFLSLEFPGGAEGQYTFGAPGSNLHQERGQVTVRVCSPRGNVANRDLAETYAAAIRSAFRMRRFAVGSRSVRITSVGPMGEGEDEGGMWSESLALGYEIYNVG